MRVRTAALFAAAALMLFGAFGFALVVAPDLHADLVEIGVRPTVLRGTVMHLYFAAAAMFGFAVITLAAAVQSLRGAAPARLPLAVIALIHIAFSLVAFSLSRNPHHLGPLLMGLLIVVALLVPGSTRKTS